VESFLAKLRDRACNFHVVWFDREECIMMDSVSHFSPKYRLARAVIIQHLSTLDNEPLSHRFSHLASREFHEYLASYPLRFFLGSRSMRESVMGEAPAGMTYKMAKAGYCVAFIELVTFQVSKVWALERRHQNFAYNTMCTDPNEGVRGNAHT
jgi:hypothetical protein